ncbi:MAG: hypothetical protein JO010_12385 [Alphaproteobacteria bacterium]|nr:hypothetical protein [Alphaproteobacteria bacterium]
MAEVMKIWSRRRKDAASPLSGREVWRLAHELIASLGVRSTSYANYQALQARQSGDRLRMTAWRWIAGATDEILRSEPEGPSGFSGD